MRIDNRVKRKICAVFVMLLFCMGSEEVVLGTETIAVEELDMGEYLEEMVVGDRQLLSVTILPFDATDMKITYGSSNPEIATINGMGRITAIAVGATTITASCGEVSASFTLWYSVNI